MQFGIFYEHQLPRPWDETDEQRLYEEALEQIELADELGIDYAWEVEHHFLEEYSHSSAPEVFLAAAAQRTEEIRLGHGIKLMPPEYNHPARVAEQVATLDLVSDGRVEFGTGESGSQVELGGFGIPVEEKYDMWHEATREVTEMMVGEPYPGYDGEHFVMEPRNVIPKPVQKPHPPLWMACSTREMIEEAARQGIGALCFAFTDENEAEEWVDTYYETFKRECEPIGHAVNPNIAMVTGFSCHEDHDVAVERGAEGFAFFQYGLAHYYAMGGHEPGKTDLWAQFQQAGGAEAFSDQVVDSAIGTPEELREHFRGFADAGVDQVILVQQGGNNRHEHICESLELFAEEVMPEFHADEEERLARKCEDLEPYIEEAMARRDDPRTVDESELPRVIPYDRDISDFTD
ncbi:LLM class flavin-dependent oxidoreductase [Natronomonas salina]|uniref:LLM class flavin-dependent oxidoreductase n=1 Tax=Natronomonas salina TaxID=1710540 RepID=UPI0015B625FE|nr:LLM class flavin-dependent oxidoreductase [Natronomonas salina]QLD87617.1 LLM class flavin-dependent oxidoreductase [Natronomonas salina]